MTPLSPLISTSFGTVGVVQPQVRQLLNAWPIPDDASDRPVAFCLADRHLGVLPSQLESCGWMYLEEDSDEDPVLVLPATAGDVAAYVVANLTERDTLTTLAAALSDRRIELVVASPGCLTSHWLQFSDREAKYVDRLVAEYLDLCPAHDPEWMDAFRPASAQLPALCKHLHPALARCERQVLIVLQGNCENHLRALRLAVHRAAC